MLEKTLSLGLDTYIKEGLKKNEPVIGELTYFLSLCFVMWKTQYM